MTSAGQSALLARARGILSGLRERGEWKQLQVLDGPMGPVARLRVEKDGRETFRDVLCFCSNNYLGLAGHAEVVEAGLDALRKYGAGTASVRFICGTFTPHLTLEHTIAEMLGVEAAYTFVSCWNATEAIFSTLCEGTDAIISDELNHACIIDSIRLAGVIKKVQHRLVYKHGSLGDLEAKLGEARKAVGDGALVWVVTDGVFSMEGSVADLPAIRKLCDRFGALLVVDDSHGTGVMGKTGRGTHEHFGMPGASIDLFTGTLGKALGGAAGGYLAGPRDVIDLIVQRARPTLFSNALPVSVAAGAETSIRIMLREPQRVARLRENVAYAREKIRAAGFNVLESPTAICPIIVGETAKAIAMSRRLLELGVYVIGFGFPVVPEGQARLRVQISAAHDKKHIDALVDALKKL